MSEQRRDPAGRFQGVAHVTIPVRDLAIAERFYVGLLGAELRRRDHPHVAFAVAPDDLLSFKRLLEAEGVPTDGPRRLGPPGQASLYFFDPFGNHLELTTTGFAGDAAIGPPDPHRLTHRWGAEEGRWRS
jgi:catechol 2,3-dioxygenase-like lactoylglutathione lyase family enzyme